ncbi:MAG TPA: TRAP transporter substrate-binding protein DctP [Polyangiaceae bacterium]
MTNKGRFAIGACVLSFFGLSPARADAATSLRVATLAPKASSWGKVLRTWEKVVTDKTAGQLKLDVYYNGVHGMEDAMVAKMKTGQLDGAVLSSVGLADIYRNVLALQLPGLLSDWKTLDRVRAALAPELTQGIKDAGFSLLSWADVGLVHPFSTGFAVRTPADIKSQHPVVFRDDPILPTMYQTIGGIVPTPFSVMEVLPGLRAGTVNFVFAPGLAVEQLQWAQHLDHVTNWTLVCVIGGTVFRTAVLDALPSDLRATFVDIQTRVGEAQTKLVRGDDEAAYARVSKKMQILQLDAADRDAWTKLSRDSVRRLSQASFPRALVEKVATLAGQPL